MGFLTFLFVDLRLRFLGGLRLAVLRFSVRLRFLRFPARRRLAAPITPYFLTMLRHFAAPLEVARVLRFFFALRFLFTALLFLFRVGGLKTKAVTRNLLLKTAKKRRRPGSIYAPRPPFHTALGYPGS